MCQSGCINENYWGDCTLRECELQVEEMLKRKNIIIERGWII